MEPKYVGLTASKILRARKARRNLNNAHDILGLLRIVDFPEIRRDYSSRKLFWKLTFQFCPYCARKATLKERGARDPEN